MTNLFQAKVGLLTLPVLNVAGPSNVLSWKDYLFDAENITVQAPAVITDANTITWEGSLDGITYATIQDLTATAIKVPGAGKMMCYNGIFSGLVSIRLAASGAVTVITSWIVYKSWRA